MTAHGSSMQPPHTAETWLFLGSSPLADTIAALAPDVALDCTPTPGIFLERLDSQRPRLAVAVAPPADERTIAGLAEAGRRADLGTVLLDAPGEVDERLAALLAGIDEAMPSPASAREIVGRLRLLAARGSARERPTRVLVADGMELDAAASCVIRDGRRVHLRPKELALLAALATDPGRVFTRRELDDRVWGTHRPDSRRVDVHVRWLRMKLEVRPDRPQHVVTVRGIGYRLDPTPR